MEIMRWIAIIIVLIFGLWFLINFWVSIKYLDPVENVHIININGTKYLTWDSPKNVENNEHNIIHYQVTINIKGSITDKLIDINRIPLFIGTDPIKSFNSGIIVSYSIYAMSGKFANSNISQGVLIT
jgi:hypothetical protein